MGIQFLEWFPNTSSAQLDLYCTHDDIQRMILLISKECDVIEKIKFRKLNFNRSSEQFMSQNFTRKINGMNISCFAVDVESSLNVVECVWSHLCYDCVKRNLL